MINYAATTRAGQRIAKYFGKDYAHVRLEVSEIIEEELLRGQGVKPAPVRWFNSSQRALNLDGGTKPRGSVASGTKATGSPGSTLTEITVVVATIFVVLTFLIGMFRVEFYVWRTLHPTAPSWMFIFK